jgi:hypothetical protein
MISHPLTHLAFREEFNKRYSKLTMAEKLRFKCSKKILPRGNDFLKSLGRYEYNFPHDRRFDVYNRYFLNGTYEDKEQFGYSVLEEVTVNLGKNKAKKYYPQGFIWKDHSENLKTERVR